MCLLEVPGFLGFFFLFFDVAINSTNEANKAALKQTIYLDVYAL